MVPVLVVTPMFKNHLLPGSLWILPVVHVFVPVLWNGYVMGVCGGVCWYESCHEMKTTGMPVTWQLDWIN